MNRIIYHGAKEVVRFPEIRIAAYNKDFYFGFYCTNFREQAQRWATRYGTVGIVNEYFDSMTEEWLDFIVSCRSGKSHDYDIVEGPMADDKIFNYIQNFIDGEISRAAFWELAKFKKPTHQISFHTARALATLKFLRGDEVLP
ncbi:MAG: DUF3990 domain-containing protein [Synergistaceae bacterium]|nr:DUF3990 domain-containing protein [Synergistaceae bacterium]